MKAKARKRKTTRQIARATWHDADEMKWAARHWAAQMGLKVPQIHLRPMTSKWASISTAGRLTLNAELLDLPKALGEFVIVHELVHLLAPRHGKLFRSFMHAYLPDWERRERELHRSADGRERMELKEASKRHSAKQEKPS